MKFVPLHTEFINALPSQTYFLQQWSKHFPQLEVESDTPQCPKCAKLRLKQLQIGYDMPKKLKIEEKLSIVLFFSNLIINRRSFEKIC